MNRKDAKTNTAPTPLLDQSCTMPEPVSRVLALFHEDLSGVAFPDVSAERLDQAVEVVRARAEEVEALRKRVAAAQQELDGSRADLEALAERGLAYARIYAQGNAELCAKLDEVKPPAPARRKRRAPAAREREGTPASSRQRREQEDDTSLPLSAVG